MQLGDAHFIFGSSGVVAGLAVGGILGRFTTRSRSWGLVLTLLVPALLAAGVAYLFGISGGSTVGLVLAYFGIFAVVPFVPALWIAIFLAARLRPAPR